MSKKKIRDIELFVVDVYIGIAKIQEYTSNFDNGESLKHSSLHWDATIRELEVIGEALNYLLKDEQFYSLSPSYFRQVVDFRNIIIHGYFGIDEVEVWDIVNNSLHTLKNDIDTITLNFLDLTEAIESQIEDYKQLQNSKIVSHLKDLK